jgi:large subunit ribosomal protein L27e
VSFSPDVLLTGIFICSCGEVVNYSHLFPTRYALELDGLKGVVGTEAFKEVTQREDAKKNIKKVLEQRYQAGKNRWFFTPLRVGLSCCFFLCMR